MSKPVKEMIRKELARRFEGLTSLAVVDFTGIDAVTTNRIRARLLEKDIRVTVVKNSLARRAFKEIGLDAASGLLDGPSAIAYGGESVVDVVRELLDISKDAPPLTVKAALLEGDVFGPDRIDELSKYPNRDEALGRVAQCVLAGGGNLVAAMLGSGARIAGVLKTIEDREGQAEPDAEPTEPAAEAPAEPAPEAAPEAPAEPAADAPAAAAEEPAKDEDDQPSQ